MKTPEITLSEGADDPSGLLLRPREAETVSLEIPVDVLVSLKKVADRRDMSVQALLKWYVGQGLRQDLARLFSDRVLANAAEVPVRHLPSEDAPVILEEIRAGASVGE